jgi:DNA-binding response OmpR family regulator
MTGTASSAAPQGPAKVLVVDDEPDVLLLLRIHFEEAGYRTVLAADGETALRRLDEERPDAVVLDVMMPVMDGWSVLEALRSRADAPPVVVLSARTTDADIARARELGAADYVTKPFEPAALLAAVARALAARPRPGG